MMASALNAASPDMTHAIEPAPSRADANRARGAYGVAGRRGLIVAERLATTYACAIASRAETTPMLAMSHSAGHN